MNFFLFAAIVFLPPLSPKIKRKKFCVPLSPAILVFNLSTYTGGPPAKPPGDRSLLDIPLSILLFSPFVEVPDLTASFFFFLSGSVPLLLTPGLNVPTLQGPIFPRPSKAIRLQIPTFTWPLSVCRHLFLFVPSLPTSGPAVPPDTTIKVHSFFHCRFLSCSLSLSHDPRGVFWRLVASTTLFLALAPPTV